MPRTPLRLVLLAAIAWLSSAAAAAQELPPEFEAALARAKLPRDALAVVVVDADGAAPPKVQHRANAAMNPASVMKLVTTTAALELLGPAYTWSTPVYLEGAVREGTLYGNVYIKGQGDPKLVQERLWLLLRRLFGLGIQTIAGDIVLDNSAFDVPYVDPGQFDGEPLRPYNASPDALLVNYKSVLMTFTPDSTAGTARVQYDPALAGVALQTSVPLSAGDCNDWRGALKADFSNPARIGFAGSYPASCLEKVWPVAYIDPKSYALRAVGGLWAEMGGKLNGTVRTGTVPATLAAARPSFELHSPQLAELIRDINKYSNNVMAQQLFLSLGSGSFDAARAVVQRWWRERLPGEEAPVLDNGSGLSRQERISAQSLARMLQLAWRSPYMPELASSLPITGVDGTMRRVKGRALGQAHLKTGSLANVVAIAGYVHAQSGHRYVLVALVNHAQANAARPALELLTDWVYRDLPSR